MFGVKFLKLNYGHLFIALLYEILLQVLPYSPAPLIQTVSGSFNINFHPEIEFCNYFALCPLLLHFSMLGSFPETIFVHLLPVPLLKCFTCIFFLIS